jgi:pimeloyl-ACP methyl ester carboxylesterase
MREADQVRTGDQGFRERTYTSQDGLRLYYRDYGDPLGTAVPVLCLAGLTRNCKDFHGLALRLSRSRRVVCPDYRGRGRSAYDPDWRRYQPRTYVDDVRHLLAVTNVHRVLVIGTSLGGILAAAMAVAVPSAVAGAVLNDVGPEIDADGLQRIVAYVRDQQPQPDWAHAARHLEANLPDLGIRDDKGWLALARNTYREGDDGRVHVDWDPALVKPLLTGDGRATDLWPLFKALRRVPVLAVRGAKSDILSEATLERMAETLPGLARVTVKGVGHAPALVEPECLEAIDAVLAEI